MSQAPDYKDLIRRAHLAESTLEKAATVPIWVTSSRNPGAIPYPVDLSADLRWISATIAALREVVSDVAALEETRLAEYESAMGQARDERAAFVAGLEGMRLPAITVGVERRSAEIVLDTTLLPLRESQPAGEP